MARLRAVLMFAATVIMLSSVLVLGARSWWVLDLFTHFRIQYLASALVLLVLLAALRKPRWCMALAICIAINAVPLIDYLPSLGRSPNAGDASTDQRIRVMTVNLSLRDFSVDPLLAIIRTESPDVLLLVEYSPRWAERLRELDALYPHQLKLPQRDAFGLALLSRYELQTAKRIELGTTLAIEARVRAPAGSFVLFGVHLRPPLSRADALERNRQLKLLAELRTTVAEPLMVIGDFNITPFSPFFSAWLKQTGLREVGVGRGVTVSWPAFLPILGIRIDHCAVSEEFEVIAHRRLAAFGSDHYPVLADLVLQ